VFTREQWQALEAVIAQQNLGSTGAGSSAGPETNDPPHRELSPVRWRGGAMYRARSKDRRRQEPSAAARAEAAEKAAAEEAKAARKRECQERIKQDIGKQEINFG